MQMIRHIVLVNWKKNASQEQIDAWIKACSRIPDECPMVYRCTSPVVVEPDPVERPSTHDYCILFDFRSREEWAQYRQHPYPESVRVRGTEVIDLERAAAISILVEAEPSRAMSRVEFVKSSS